MEEDGATQSVAGLSLVKPGMAALAQLGIGQPLQGEEGPFDASNRPSARDRALPAPAAASLRRMTAPRWTAGCGGA